MENMKNDKGYESDGGDSDSNASVKTVKSVEGNKKDVLNPIPQLPSTTPQRSRRTSETKSLESSVQVNRLITTR